MIGQATKSGISSESSISLIMNYMIKDFQVLVVSRVPEQFSLVKMYGPADGGGKPLKTGNVAFIKNDSPGPLKWNENVFNQISWQ